MIRPMSSRLLIFTDLDGTLLDAQTYSWEPARPALNLIGDRQIPWVICTSKTRAELEPLRRDLKHRHPFIVENGGAVLIPEGYFTVPFSYDKQTDGYRTVELGTAYSVLRTALKEIERETRTVTRGFGDLTVDEISQRTGLGRPEAQRAKVREYDEPFFVDGTPDQEKVVLKQIESKGFRWTKGGRFCHLTGENDKGRAVRILSEIYRKDRGPFLTVGLGDGLNDLPMFEAVDRPILVQQPDGCYENAVSVTGLVRADGIGPVGWNREVLRLLDALSRSNGPSNTF